MAPRQRDSGKDMPPYTDMSHEKVPADYGYIQSSNCSVAMGVGSYNNLVLPLLLFGTSLIISIYPNNGNKMHPLSEGLYLLDNFSAVISVLFMYIVFCTVWGPRMMKDRDPIKLKFVIQCYNIFQVVLCCYMFYEYSMAGWLTRYNYSCEPSSYSTQATDARLASVSYIYYLSKYLDLLDTVFFVLNKKWEHISVLHLFHHSSMVANTCGVAFYMPIGHITFGGFVNSFIHIVMYSYYFLASLGPAVRPYLWWKKYLTMLQIFQLATIALHTSQVFFNGCDVNITFIYPLMFASIVYLLLFVNFYFKAYKKTV